MDCHEPWHNNSNHLIQRQNLFQPSSNEVLSSEKSVTKPSSSTNETDASQTEYPFNLDSSDSSNDVSANDNQSSMTATTAKSGRQYITSFTTTTTIRPDLSRGVEIIRSLVEQARTTPPVPTGFVQSLTTLKTMPASKETTLGDFPSNKPMTTTTTTTSTTARTTITTRSTTKMPANHKMASISSTTRRMPPNHQMRDELIRSFTERQTTTTKSKPRPSQAPIDIEDLQDLLNKVQTTTTPKVLSCQFVKRNEMSQRFLSIPQKVTTPVTIKPDATVKSNINLPSTSTFDDLLNSFQALPTTTRRPQLTTFSDVDDIAFLQGLVSTTRLFAIVDPFKIISNEFCFAASNCH